MVSRERVLLIVAADRRELAGLLGLLRRPQQRNLGVRWAIQGHLDVQSVLLVANGPGRLNAQAAVEQICARVGAAAVLSAGLCGALDPELAPGQVVVADRVLLGGPPEEFAVQLPAGLTSPARVGPVLTVDRMVQTATERQRLRGTGAAVVEMEAAGAAAAAAARGLPFYCVKVVSDGVHDSFAIDYNRARRKDGGFSAWRIIAQAGFRPRRWQELLMWRQRLQAGSEVLGRFLEGLNFEKRDN